MGEVRVNLKSVFGLSPATGRTEADPYVRISLLAKSKVLDSFTSSISKGAFDPEYEEDFVFAKVAAKHDQLSLKLEVMDATELKITKKDQLLGCCHVLDLRKIKNLEVQRKLMNAKGTEGVDGVIFVEYSYEPEGADVAEADMVDGDDGGTFCGFVYVEAIDAIDLDADHLILKKGDQDDEEDEAGLATKQRIDWNTVMEVSCSKTCRARTVPFSWRSLEVEGTPNPSWNEGCSFPIDFETSDSLKPVKIRVLQDEQLIGQTMCDIPLTPVSRIYVKRIYDHSHEVRGYICVKVGFVPFGFRVVDLLSETVMDDNSTADFLGMRRKYADVIAQNHDFQDAMAMLQDRIDELEGVRKGGDDEEAGKEGDERREKKGPSQKARWHFFAMAAEPWSKATKVSAYRLRGLLEESLPDRRHQVVPLIRATTTSAYLNFRECNMVLKEFDLGSREWRRLVKTVMRQNLAAAQSPPVEMGEQSEALQ
ncbi:unnamed protein product [Amoebophrya sp. A25]|nr:unnamed protein product [Amoebophrya sp. A25]|eukprot:GSA25T00013889001.1